jgi:chemotaxis protein CheD
MKQKMTRLQLGDTHTTDDPSETIIASLGSCIAACIRDPATGIGGMNHFMLPESETGLSSVDPFGAATLFGNFAMEMLVNSVLGMGCPRGRLEIKLFGGANFPQDLAMSGTRNTDFVMRYLSNESLMVALADLGGSRARRIHYHPGTGRIRRIFLAGETEKSVILDESKYRVAHHNVEPEQGAIRLFQ